MGKKRAAEERKELIEAWEQEVADSKKVEEEHLRREKRLKAVIDSMLDGVTIVDMQGRIISVNDAALRQHGYAMGDVVGKSPTEVFLDERDVEKFKERLQLCLAGEPGEAEEYLSRRKDGTRFPTSVNISILRDEAGRPQEIVAVHRDITERKRVEQELIRHREQLEELVAGRTEDLERINEELQQEIADREEAEKALKQSEEDLSNFFNTSIDFLWVLDNNGNILKSNETVERRLGYNETELIGRSFLYVHPPERRGEAAQIVKDMLKGDRDSCPVPLMTKDGQQIPVDTRIVNGIWNGKPAIFGRSKDISELKQAEEEMQKLALVIKYSSELVNLADLNGKMIFINEAGSRMLGINPEEVEETNIMEVIPAHLVELVEKELLPALTRGDTWEGDLQYRNLKTGVLTDVHAMTFTVKDPDSGKPQFLANVSQDITERKRAEKEVLKAQKLESVGILAGGIAHDFNNILMTIWGNIRLAKMELDPGGRPYGSLGQAEKGCRRAKDLALQLITFSKGGAPVKKPTSLVGLLRDATAIALSGSNVQCELMLPADLWAAEVDEGQINQVFSNLCINAVHAMPEGGTIRVVAENTVLTVADELPLTPGKYVKIMIQDYGLGIKKENLVKIFDPYFTTKQKGSGLGLAVAYSIVNNHGGYITVESEPGRGTCFHILFPACETALPGEECAEEVLVPGKGRILVMDDEEMVRELVGQFLERLGYEVAYAEDGGMAIEIYGRALASEEPFDAVILDLTVPGGMGGKEAVKGLLKIDPGVKAIVSSGYSNDPVLADYEKFGFVCSIPKPYEMGPLSEAVQRVISAPH